MNKRARITGGNVSTEITSLLCYKNYTNELEDYLSKNILRVNDCIYTMNMHCINIE